MMELSAVVAILLVARIVYVVVALAAICLCIGSDEWTGHYERARQ